MVTAGKDPAVTMPRANRDRCSKSDLQSAEESVLRRAIACSRAAFIVGAFVIETEARVLRQVPIECKPERARQMDRLTGVGVERKCIFVDAQLVVARGDLERAEVS